MTNGMLPSYEAAYPDLLQSETSKGDHHHEPEESEQAEGAAAARTDRCDRRAKCGELLCQSSTLAEIAGGQVRQEAGSVLSLAAGNYLIHRKENEAMKIKTDLKAGMKYAECDEYRNYFKEAALKGKCEALQVQVPPLNPQSSGT
jgi:hypothetical protein